MPLYVQYGCGWCAPAEWRNFDASPTLRWERLPILGKLYTKNAARFPSNVEYGNVVKGLPIGDGSADGVYCSHVLEHLPRDAVGIALANSLRILRPNGVFRLVVPDLHWRVEKYLQKLASHEETPSDWLFDALNMGQRQSVSSMAGAAKKIFGHSEHLWMYDLATMSKLLQSVGFVEIRECDFNDSTDAMFNLVEDRERFFSEDHKEVCLEAHRPNN